MDGRTRPLEAVLRSKPSSIADRAPLPMIPAFRARSENDIESQPVPPGDPYAFYRLMAAAIRSEAAVPVDPVAARNVVAIIEAAHAGRDLPAPRSAGD